MKVKICGLKDAANVEAAVKAGADYIGFVFFEKSPRNVSHEQAAALARNVPAGVIKTALVVDPSDADLSKLCAAVPIDLIQLHGHETPQRVREVKTLTGLPVLKAVGISDDADLPALKDYARVADQILVDAKPPKGTVLPGGNGLKFDWQLIKGLQWDIPWMLAGGLTPENAAVAIQATGAAQLDVSSGVESAPGLKDPALIARFIAAAHAA